MLVNERVLVTGGAGYIGSILTRRLIEHGYSVTILDNFLYQPDSLEGLESTVRIIAGDIRDRNALKKAFQGARHLVHLAEIVGEPACNFDPAEARSVNLEGTRLLGMFAKKTG